MSTEQEETTTVVVDAGALREILTALNGHQHQPAELMAISSIRGDECPIRRLTRQYNQQIAGSS